MTQNLPPTRLSLISHAATAAQRRAAFPLDEPLESVDYAKVMELGWHSPQAQQIFCGPELRARQTAQALGLQQEISHALRDCDYGRWVGQNLDEVQASEPEGVLKWLTDPEVAPHEGESVAKLIERVGTWLDQLEGTGHTIAVTHPAVIRAAIVYILDAPLQMFWRIDIAPLSLTDLRFNGRSWTLRCSSCTLLGINESTAQIE